MRIQHFLIAAGVLATAFGLGIPAWGQTEPSVEALRIRHFSDAVHTRIVIDLTDMVPYQVRSVHEPDRVVLELPGVRHVSTATVPLGDSRVHRVRRNQTDNRTQVVIDLRGPKRYRAFEIPLQPEGVARIVVDVFGDERVPKGAAASIPREQPQAKVPVAAKAKPSGAPAAKASSRSRTPPPKPDPYVIVIDPGHGGSDTGTPGCGIVLEKQVTLGIARYMKAALSKHEGIQVVLTRRSDEAVSLQARRAIAERAGGDVFVSIHANSAPRRSARGAEVFFVSRRGASNAAAAELADRENAAAMVGVEPERAGDEDLMSILMDLKGSAILQRSGLLAELALREVAKTGVTRSRAVKQANFLVLRTLSMPAILVEAGFISNKSEAKRLRSSQGQKQIGEALARSVLMYCARYGEKSPPKPLVVARMHTVKRGDTLWDLAAAHDTSVQAIRSANNMTNTRLRVGQKLILP